jgi:hypothetical protein
MCPKKLIVRQEVTATAVNTTENYLDAMKIN